MENYTHNSLILQVEGLKITGGSIYPVFSIFIFLYIFIIFSNLGILILIVLDKSLHRPMYLLFLNLPVNDILGNSNVIPRLLVDMLRPPSERLISYYECVVQAFITHMCGTAGHTVLMISLTVRLSRCRTIIKGLYCSNPSLFKLSCESVFINHVYGFTFAVSTFTASIGSILLTYSKITVVCLTSKNKSLNRKALQTCSTHLSVYLIMLFCGMFIIVLHRFPQHAMLRETASILLNFVPSSLNPIIYGIQSKEIQKFLSNLCQHRKVLKRV
ncbi:olfactory receptor 5M11-like [Sphaeramia orbicularis]|uniref:olfactory receptor 5M11-like n=1 Tax=Sphaeramia orbicularis TaxID=375764 RepID=UPI00117E4340|nr:olfactory receptor 5M11-like [Sphaeramia orbicularis]